MNLAVLLSGMLLWANTAKAACETQVQVLEATSPGAGVTDAYAAVAACDGGEAATQLPVALIRATDASTMATVASTAIEAGSDAAERVRELLDGIEDYGDRDALARTIGARCTDEPHVLSFLRGLHSAVKDRRFVAWGAALAACPDAGLTADLEALAKEPPARSFDDKYGKVVELFGMRAGASALPVLQGAAIAAADAGPLPVILDGMVRAVTPAGYGKKPQGDDRAALLASLLGVGQAVGPEPAGRVADVLVNQGDETGAASLLPRIHPGKELAGGGFRYGVIAIEPCGDDPVLHWAVVHDAKSRWSIASDVDGLARAFKGKVKDCAPDSWTVRVSPSPVLGADEVAAWVAQVAAAEGMGDAKQREEKAIRLN